MSDPTPYIGDLYDTLGVERTATQDEIKKAFRKLARAHHPDVAGDDPQSAARFDRIRKAYDVLGDPEARARYDRGPVRRPRGGGRWTDQGYRMPGGLYARTQPGPRTTTSPSGRGRRRRDPANNMSLDDIFGDFGVGGSSPQKTRARSTSKAGANRGQSRSGIGIDIDALADGLPGAGFAGGGTYAGPQTGGLGGGAPGGSSFGGGGGGAPDNRSSYGQRGADGMRTGTPGRDIQMTVDVPADVAQRGGSVTLEYPRMRVSEDGRGLFRYDELHDLRVPPGVRHGQVLHVHHMGDDGTDGSYGDLLCELRVVGKPSARPSAATGRAESRGRTPPRARASAPQASPSKRAAGADPWLEISVVEALLGGRVEVDTPTGRVRLTIPAGSSGGARLRLRGRGPDGSDHHVVLRIVVPKNLDNESRHLIEQFAALNPMDVRD